MSRSVEIVIDRNRSQTANVRVTNIKKMLKYFMRFFISINVFCVRAQRIKCTNAKFPDLYGHYREAKFTQTKHHWWWKANRIFEQLRATKYHSGKIDECVTTRPEDNSAKTNSTKNKTEIPYQS
jgi:hypothetical protein